MHREKKSGNGGKPGRGDKFFRLVLHGIIRYNSRLSEKVYAIGGKEWNLTIRC
jgi:hypothetical protein